MKFTLLTDLQDVPGFHSEFGLSLLLENSGERWLFDTGSSDAFIENSRILNIPDGSFDKVILSHGHYDHTGGLAALRPRIIYAVNGVEQGHFSKHSEEDIHNISMPENSRAVLKRSQVVSVDDFTEIAPGIFLSGPIPRFSGEDCGGNFFHDIECGNIDIVPEEQCLLTSDGIFVTGCCHAGIINSLEYCRRNRPEITIRAVVGGLHLRNADTIRLRETAEYLRCIGVKHLFIGHCTGKNAVEFLKNALPECQIVSPRLGSSWEI